MISSLLIRNQKNKCINICLSGDIASGYLGLKKNKIFFPDGLEPKKKKNHNICLSSDISPDNLELKSQTMYLSRCTFSDNQGRFA